MGEVSHIYAILDPETFEWYKGSGKWVGTLQKAKKYRRMCDAANAVTSAREYKYIKKNKTLEIHTLEIIITPVHIREMEGK